MPHAVPGRFALGRAAFLISLLAGIISAAPQAGDLAAKSRYGKELMAAGRFAEAVAVYDELCKAQPGNPGLRLNLGLALQMAGRQREAIPNFEFVLRSDPNSIPALMSLGAARLETNDAARAIQPLERVVALQPAYPDARGMLANALLSLGRPKEASTHFLKLTSLQPDDPKAWYGLGRSYEMLATQAFDQLTKTAQASAEWLALVAESRVARRQYRSAFYFYHQALEKDPKMRGLHAGLAEVYRATEHPDWAAAEEKKEQALARPDCRREKALCDFQAGHFLDAAASPRPYWRSRAYNELATAAFAKLGSLPESVELHALKAEIASNHGQYSDAASEWRDALKLAPGDERLEREHATSVYLAHDYKTALPLIMAQLKHEPRSPEWNFFAGDSLLRLEQPERALPYLDDAVRADPKLLPAQASLGMALARVAQPGAAVPHLEAALPIDEDGSLQYQLARAYQASGEPSKAKAAMAKYQDTQKRLESEKHDLDEKVQITPP